MGRGVLLPPPPPHQLIMGPVIIKGLSYCWFFCTCKWKHLSKSLTGHKNLTQWLSVGTEMGVWRMGKRTGEKLYTLILFGVFFQNIFTWVLAQTCGTGTSRYRHQACMGAEPPREIQLQPLANIHRLTSNYALVFLSVKYKSNVCPAYL